MTPHGTNATAGVVCPLCESRDTSFELQRSTPLASDEWIVESGLARKGDVVVFHACRRCGLVFRGPRPTPDELSRYYAETLPPAEPGIVSRMGVTDDEAKARTEWRFRREFRQIRHFVSSTSGHVIDVGGASGQSLIPWIEAGWQATLIDPGIEARPVLEGTFLKISSVNEALRVACPPADILLSYHCIEHLVALRTSLEELRALSAVGSLWVLEVPLELPYITGLLSKEPIARPKIHAQHLNFFTPQSLRWAAQSLGLTVLRSRIVVVLYWFGPAVALRLYATDDRRSQPTQPPDAFDSPLAFRRFLRWRLPLWRRGAGLKFRYFRYRCPLSP